MKSYIYKIYSNDEKMHYYGLTTKTIQIRFEAHFTQYNLYTQQKITNYCSSYKIFNNYNIQDIKIQIVEEHDNLPLYKLRQREKYYIQNYDCVNISGKNIKTPTEFYTLSKKIIQYNNIIHENIPLQNISLDNFDNINLHTNTHNNTTNNKPLHDIIQLFGYTIQNNTLTHEKQATFSKIKTQLYNHIQKNFTQYQIQKNNILYTTNNILYNHNLQILYKKIPMHKNKNFYTLIYLLIQPYTPSWNDYTDYIHNYTTDTQILQ
jgi:hypothetical protein